ncbi:alternative oxidase [Tribonema minus]|uniref:Alternative oxidase n=1 Tax=Tribonema minus TaxID=303371 RepID=A0A835YR99_9STRA|nr:alternative oxidase [Tribonema minus]
MKHTYPITSDKFASLVQAGVTPECWLTLLSKGTKKIFQAGQLLLEEGTEKSLDQERRGVYLVLEGTVHLEVKGRKLTALGPGTFGGEASFVSKRKGPRTATLRVTSPQALAVRWDTADLEQLLAEPENAVLKMALYAYWTQELATKLTSAMRRLEAPPGAQGAPSQAMALARSYGFRRSPKALAEAPDHAVVPPPAIALALKNFAIQYAAVRRGFRFGEISSDGVRTRDPNANPLSKLFGVVDAQLDNLVLPKLKIFSTAREVAIAEAEAQPGGREALEARRAALRQLTLSNEAIARREDERMARFEAFVRSQARAGLGIAADIQRSDTPWFVLAGYKLLCWMLDFVFEGRPIQRFWFLESVARMPYFSYLSMLHLYETLGWWSVGTEVRRVHFSEEWNEMNHLKIMEALGGDMRWSDRFLARHAAIVYYWALNILFLFSPFLAYNFSKLIESHAVDTYGEFVETNKELLQSLPPPPEAFVEANKELLESLPPPPEAVAYYVGGDMYMFDEFQSGTPAFTRRPVINSLYDVFCNIRDDEREHVKTMFACEREGELVRSPNELAARAIWEDVDEDDADDALTSALNGGANAAALDHAAASAATLHGGGASAAAAAPAAALNGAAAATTLNHVVEAAGGSNAAPAAGVGDGVAPAAALNEVARATAVDSIASAAARDGRP